MDSVLKIMMVWQAEREPLLSSFLYASILAHPCFERSLGFVLANRLTSATLLATQLMDVFDGVFMTDPFIRQAIRLDVQVSSDLLILGFSSKSKVEVGVPFVSFEAVQISLETYFQLFMHPLVGLVFDFCT